MADEFDEFDDFDSDIANAAEAEAAEEETQEVATPPPVKRPNPFQKKAPVAQPVAPKAPAPVPVAPQPRRQPRAMGTRPAPQIRFEAYSSPLKYGILDNQSGQVHAESEDPIKLLIALIVEIKNDLEELKQIM